MTTARSVWMDVRHAVRLMCSAPALTAGVLFTIALAVGANTAMFSVVNSVLLRPLPYPDADRLVTVAEQHAGATTNLTGIVLTNITYHAWGASGKTIDGIGAYQTQIYTVSGGDGPERLRGARLSPSLLRVLRVAPRHGRWFTDEEGSAAGQRVAMVNEGFARRRFGVTEVVGRLIELNGTSHEIVGVMPARFLFPRPDASAVYTPYHVRLAEAGSGSLSFFPAVARLSPDGTAEQAAAEATAAARGSGRPTTADTLFGRGGAVEVRVQALAEQLTARVRPAILVLAAAFGLLLLIASANVGNLFLSHSLGRERELAVRAAFGAGRRRLVRQLLTESLVIALTGGMLGIGIGWSLTRAVPKFAPANFPRLDEIAVDWRVLIAAALASVIVGALAGALPALRGARALLASAVRDGDARLTRGDRRHAGAVLLAVQTAVSLVLLIGALLLGRSFANLLNVDMGYDPNHVLIASLSLPRGAPHARGAEFGRNLLDRLRRLPGVVVAGIGSSTPFSGGSMIQTFPMQGLTGSDGQPLQEARALSDRITPGYIEALGMRVLEGRAPVATDKTRGIEPLIVNQTFARAYLNDGRAVAGRQFRGLLGSTAVEIIGVVADVRSSALVATAEPQIYFVQDGGSTEMSVAVRTAGDPADLAIALRSMIKALDPSVLVDGPGTLSSRVALSVAEPRFSTTVLASVATLAVLLAAIGLYGALSYRVSQRRREIGLRSALGADRGHLVSMVLRQGMGVTVVGLTAGLIAAAFLTKLLSALLYGVDPIDPLSFGAAAALLLAVAFVASWIPARRAASLDPVETLRAE